MKVKLVVAQGVHEGREIPIAGVQFVIGRDPQCQLRPSSPAISKKHCAILIKGNKVFVRDFGSTNGTFADGVAIQGEVEVVDKTLLKVGPLDFRMSIEMPTAVAATAAPAKPKSKTEESDDDFAALLLEGDTGASGLSGDGIPEGSTVMEMGSMGGPGDAKAVAKPDPKKAAEADTRSAAADILKLYQRRPRS